jgi:hypothetical protein
MQVGVFQVRMELLTAAGDILDTASHPCMLRYPGSQLKRMLMSALRIPVLFFTGMDETQEIELELFRRRVEHRHAPLAAVRVALLPRSGRKTPPQVYSAHLCPLPHPTAVVELWLAVQLVALSPGGRTGRVGVLVQPTL